MKIPPIIINKEYLTEVLGPLIGLGDLDDEQIPHDLLAVNPTELQTINQIVAKYLVPEFKQWGPTSQKQAKLALAWLLTLKDTEEKEREAKLIFDSILAPFETPKPAISIYEFLWVNLFGNEPFALESQHYKVKRLTLLTLAN